MSKVKKESFFNKFRPGTIGFWSAYSLIMPMIGFFLCIGIVYNVSPWLAAHKTLGIPIFIACVSVFSGVAILPTSIVALSSGWSFGFLFGLLTMLLSIAGAVTFSFFLARRLGGKQFESFYEKKPKLNAIHQAILFGKPLKVIFIVMLLRLSPAMPFAMTNFMLAASGISLGSFLLGTLLGYLPRMAAMVFVGASLTQIDVNNLDKSWLVLLGIVATLLVIVVIALISKKALNNLTVTIPNRTEKLDES
ncbi:MAG: TVP38/TMEM64 family protein [Pyrinomonadaceae bacterium]